MSYQLEDIFNASPDPGQYAQGYFQRLQQVMSQVDTAVLARVVEALEAAIARGNTIYLIANGGSAAVAGHFVNDAVVGAAVAGQPPIRALSLSDNTESITAIANDMGWENAFSHQLAMMMNPGDVVIAMSVSGNSPNIVSGVQWAKAHGGVTIGWTGFSGGQLAELADHVIFVPSTNDEYGPIEDMFSILEHTILTYLAMKRGRKLYH